MDNRVLGFVFSELTPESSFSGAFWATAVIKEAVSELTESNIRGVIGKVFAQAVAGFEKEKGVKLSLPNG